MASDATINWPDPDMSLVRGREVRPPRFPLEIFSDEWRGTIELIGQATNTPSDWAASAVFPVASAALGNVRRVSAHREWNEPLIFWVMIFGISGDGKSPALEKVVAPLEEIEDDLLSEWEHEKKEIEKANELLPEGEQKSIPPMPEIIVQDATAERVVKMLQYNPRGGLAWADEIMALIRAFDRYRGKGKATGDEEFWLMAFGGRRWKRTRMLEVEAVVVRLWFSMMGGIQPDVFTELLTRPNNGFLPRFLYSYPEALPPSWPTQFYSHTFIKRALLRLRSLDFADAGYNGGPAEERNQPVLMKLTDKAVERFQAFRNRRYENQATTGGLYQTWLGKADGYVLRFAGMLPLLDWAAKPDDMKLPPPSVVNETDIDRGVELFTKYYAPMAQQVFGEAALNPVEYGARIIAKNILKLSRLITTDEDGTRIIGVDKVRRGRILHTLNTAEAVRDSVMPLVRSGWLRDASARKGNKKGRMREEYAINPKVFEAPAVVVKSSPPTEAAPPAPEAQNHEGDIIDPFPGLKL